MIDMKVIKKISPTIISSSIDKESKSACTVKRRVKVYFVTDKEREEMRIPSYKYILD